MKKYGVVLMAVVLAGGVQAGQVRLNPTDHPVGTRILRQCESVGSSILVGGESRCVSERVIREWSPSGVYVSLRVSNGAEVYDWVRAQDVPVVEVLPKDASQSPRLCWRVNDKNEWHHVR